jgi:GntR family transcriptional regulator
LVPVFRLNPSSGAPLYLQLVESLKHALATGAIKAGEQLPSVRKMAEDLLINPNTVVRAYRDLEQNGIVELRHGSGVFVRESVVARKKLMDRAEPVIQSAVDRLESFGLVEEEIRRLVENELAVRRTARQLAVARRAVVGRPCRQPAAEPRILSIRCVRSNRRPRVRG